MVKVSANRTNPVNAIDRARRRPRHIEYISERLRATSNEMHAELMVIQRQGNCVSCRIGNLSQIGLLSAVDMKNPINAIVAGATAFLFLLNRRITAGTDIVNVASASSGNRKSLITLGDGAKRKLFR